MMVRTSLRITYIILITDSVHQPTMIAESTPFGGIELKQTSKDVNKFIGKNEYEHDDWERWYGKVNRCGIMLGLEKLDCHPMIMSCRSGLNKYQETELRVEHFSLMVLWKIVEPHQTVSSTNEDMFGSTCRTSFY